MIDPKRRELFADLYRLAEYFEAAPFQPGDIDGNANWFIEAVRDHFGPFINKYDCDQYAIDLAMAVLDEANRRAVIANKMASVL